VACDGSVQGAGAVTLAKRTAAAASASSAGDVGRP
jgi:hypothetical protein